jgi:hypothetical protein
MARSRRPTIVRAIVRLRYRGSAIIVTLEPLSLRPISGSTKLFAPTETRCLPPADDRG